MYETLSNNLIDVFDKCLTFKTCFLYCYLKIFSNPLPGQVLKPDITKKPSSLTTSTTTSTPTGTNPASTKEDLARYHIVAELLQTETNFVKILNTIVKVRCTVLL